MNVCSCTGESSTAASLNGKSEDIKTDGLFGDKATSKLSSATTTEADDVSSRAIKLNEGWSPTLYT